MTIEIDAEAVLPDARTLDLGDEFMFDGPVRVLDHEGRGLCLVGRWAKFICTDNTSIGGKWTRIGYFHYVDKL